jgi:hypothetical protein
LDAIAEDPQNEYILEITIRVRLMPQTGIRVFDLHVKEISTVTAFFNFCVLIKTLRVCLQNDYTIHLNFC